MIKQTEGEIDDIASSAGPFSQKAKATLRAQGNLEVIKIKLKGGTAGDKDKKKVKELQAKLAKSQQELKDMATKNQDAINKAKEDKEKGAKKNDGKDQFDGDGDGKLSDKEREAKNSKDGQIKRYKDLIAKTDDEEKKKKFQSKLDALQKESWELFLDPKYVAVLESELVKYESELV